METLKANIFKDDELLFENVIVDIRLVAGPGLPEWTGHFEIPKSGFIVPGGPYRFEFTDGRTGEFIVNNLNMNMPGVNRVHFVGSLK